MAVKAGINKLIGTNQVLTGIILTGMSEVERSSYE